MSRRFLRRPAPAGEIARRRRVLAAIAHEARPDEPVRRAEHLPVQRIRLTARQWELVRLADGRRTPRNMAAVVGSDVLNLTLEVSGLVRAGVLEAISPEVAGTPTPFLGAVRGE